MEPIYIARAADRGADCDRDDGSVLRIPVAGSPSYPLSLRARGDLSSMRTVDRFVGSRQIRGWLTDFLGRRQICVAKIKYLNYVMKNPNFFSQTTVDNILTVQRRFSSTYTRPTTVTTRQLPQQ
jgi:hypothetical protein